MQSPDGLISGELWLYIGKCLYKQDIKEKAKDAFMRAYMLEGEKIFIEEDAKYFYLIQDICM